MKASLMDEQPPSRDIPPRTTHAHFRTLHPSPRPQPRTASPLGVAIGCLAAGAWSIGFARWFALTGFAFWLVAGLGYILIALGLLLIGASIVSRR